MPNHQSFDILSGLLPLSVGNAWGNGLNGPGEIFIGTRVATGLIFLFDIPFISCSNIAEEVTYPYCHFPTRRGVAALNSAGRFFYG